MMKNDFQQVSWIAATNVYEVNLRQYTKAGTLASFSTHVSRLHDMGVDVLWFMPITSISYKNRKGQLGSYYACSSYSTFNPEFGLIDEFKQLVKAAHQLGMKVIIDWVANHTGCDHEWTISFPTFYKLNEHGNFYDAHGWDDVIDLDYENPQMRLEMIDAMSYWVDEFDIDGFRCDMAMLTPVDFWYEARTHLDQKKNLFWLAELDPLDNPSYMEVFDSAYSWRWMNTAKSMKEAGARDIYSLRNVLEEYSYVLPSSAGLAWFTSNHDENSWNGTEYEKYGEMAIPLSVFSALWKGIPLLYSGQEIPNLKRLAFFDKDQLEWNKDVSLHDFFKVLFNFRKKNEAFKGDLSDIFCHHVHNSVSHHVLSFKRVNKFTTIYVAINFSEYRLSNVEFGFTDSKGRFCELFTSAEREFNESFQYIDLKPWGYQVWHQ
jgi:hypothetical protein